MKVETDRREREADPRSSRTPAQGERLGAVMLGKAALPRRRGRLAFDAPWEIQAFALAVALSQEGIYGAEEFRSHLIGELNGDTNNVHGYYQCWLASFETLLIQKGFLSSEEIDRKVAEFSMY